MDTQVHGFNGLSNVKPEELTTSFYCEQQQLRDADEVARRDPLLRTQIVELVEVLELLVKEHAFQLAKARGNAGAFAEEVESDLICWQLAEFLVQGRIDRDPIELPILRGWQLTVPHACDWFEVNRLSDNTFAATKIEAVQS